MSKVSCKEIPRWRLEGGSRKRASYSEILERPWRHTLQAKPPRRGKTLTPPHLQPAQRISKLNGETRRAPRPPLAGAQTDWEDVDQVSFAVPRYSQTSLDQNSIAPWTDWPPPGEKQRNWVISNKSKKDTRERGWSTLSAKDWGKGLLPGTINKQARRAGEALAGAGRTPSNKEGKACESGGGRKTP
jgi:hypothetical protein